VGTNYYAMIDVCEKCGRAGERIHIGKSSAGWTFSFHATEKIKSYADWLAFLSKKDIIIYDEYGEKISLEMFKKIIETKRSEPNNHAKEYPESGSYLDKDGNSMSPYEFS